MLKISLLIGGIFLVSEKTNPSGRGILIQHFKCSTRIILELIL